MSTPARATARITRFDAYVALALIAALGWVVLMVQQRYTVLPFHSPLPGHGVIATPVAAIALLVFVSPTNRAIRVFAVLTGTVALALLLAPVLDTKPIVALAAPVVLVAVVAMLRWPALGLALLVAITGSFGALTAFFGFHYNKVLAAVLAGLWAAAIVRQLAGARTQRMRFPLCAVALTLYLAITVVQAVTAADRAPAIATLQHDDWYMAAVLLLAFAGWSIGTHRRLAGAAVVAAALVGGYATLRWSIGPAAAERELALKSTFNVVNGRLKLIGSFSNGADLALWTSIAIPFCTAFALAARGRWRWIAAAAAVLCSIGLVGSQVRAGTAAVTAGLLVTLLLFQTSRAFAGLHLGTTLAAVAAIAVAALGAFAYTGGSASSSHSFVSLFNGNDQSTTSHTYKWGQALRDLGGHPFGFGVGSAATGYAGGSIPASQYANSIAAQSVDSGYLKIALEQGLAVMAIFIAGLLTLLVGLGAGAVRARDPEHAALLIGAAGVLTVFMVLFGAGAFMEGLPSLFGWMLIGSGLAQLASRPVRARARAREAGGRPRDADRAGPIVGALRP